MASTVVEGSLVEGRDGGFGDRCEERYGVHFLECAFGCEVCFGRAGEEEGGEGIGGRVSNLFKLSELLQSCWVFGHTPAMPWRTPGPPTSRQTPGLPVM